MTEPEHVVKVFNTLWFDCWLVHRSMYWPVTVEDPGAVVTMSWCSFHVGVPAMQVTPPVVGLCTQEVIQYMYYGVHTLPRLTTLVLQSWIQSSCEQKGQKLIRFNIGYTSIIYDA